MLQNSIFALTIGIVNLFNWVLVQMQPDIPKPRGPVDLSDPVNVIIFIVLPIIVIIGFLFWRSAVKKKKKEEEEQQKN